MRVALVAVLLCVAVAVSAQPKPSVAKGGAPLQAKMASLKPVTVPKAGPRASPNQSCTALNGAATVTGTCWTADTCKKHSGAGLPAVTAQAPGNKCPAGQSCCVLGLKPPAPTTPAAPAPVKPPAPVQPPAPQPQAPQAPANAPKAAGFVDVCAPYTVAGGKPSRYGCMRCVNTFDKNQLRCHFSTQTGTCYGSGYRYGEAAWAYERLLKERSVDKPGDCERL